MSKILNVQLSWTVQTTKPATTGYLVYDGFQTGQGTYDTILDASSDNSLSNKTDYAIPTIAGITFAPVNYSDTVTLPAPASKYTNTENKWTTVYVPDNYTIPPSEATWLTDGFAFTNAQHTGVAVKNLSYNVQTEAAGTLSFGAFQVSTAQNGKSAALGALSALGIDDGTVTAIGNIATVSSALSRVQSDGLALAALGIKEFGSPTGVSFAQYDAAVNNYLAASRDALDKAVDGLTLSSNPLLDKAAHAAIESGRLIENLSSGDAVPFSASATLGLEVNFGGVLAISGSVTGTASMEVVIGGNAGDTVSAISNVALIVGGRGAETIIAGPGNDYINAGGGDDRVVLGNQTGYDYVDGGTGATTVALPGAFSGYSVNRQGSTYIESSTGSLAFATLKNVSTLTFADGSVSLATHDPLFDPVFYDRTYADVYRNGVAAEAHYDAFGASEGRNPDALFSTSGYLAANQDVKEAGANPLDHYDQYGWKEGRDPSAGFNTRLYLLQNPDVAATGIDPLLHYLAYGRFEGRQTAPAIGKTLGPNGFDPEFYLLSNPDVARAGLDPYQHYEQFGWREGRAPNASFDPGYYLRTNPDVAAAGVDPLLHYDLYGWKEGRNPSASFDTTLYLYHNRDVAAAGVDPLFHYLAYGIFEGRAAYMVPAAVPVGATVSGTANPGHPGAVSVQLAAGQRYTFDVGDRASTGNQSYISAPLVTLVSSTGMAVGNAADLPGATGVQFGFTAPATGTYIVSVDPGTAGNGGTFSFKARTPSLGDLAIVGSTGGSSTMSFAPDLGAQFPGSGTLLGVYSGYPHLTDEYFKFSLITAGQIEVDLDGVQGGMSLLDATGHVLATQHQAGVDEQVVAALPTGSYYIDLAARGPNPAEPGFTLRLYA